jgi:Zn-dependent peptidase ImmA (M78 family)
MHTDELTPSQVGERLRLAREAANFTQVAAATTIGIARTTLVAVEKGQRRVRMDELQELAKLYGASANALLRREAVHVDLVPRFRKGQRLGSDAIQMASQLLTDLAKAEVELENLLGVRRTANYPPERPIRPGDAVVQAERDALEVRQRAGLGLQPIHDITTLLELEFGVRVYVRPLDRDVSGLFAFDNGLGACMLLNADHRRERRNYTAGHELGHLVSTRGEPDVLHARSPERTLEERYANAFARSFLTPSRAVIEKLSEVTAGATILSRRHVIVMAYSFGVSREAMVRRLEELGQTRRGTWDWFVQNGGITDEQSRQVLGDLHAADRGSADAGRPTTLRLSMLAEEAWRRGLLSEGQLARLLRIERIDLRELLGDLESGEEAGDEAPVLLR